MQDYVSILDPIEKLQYAEKLARENNAYANKMLYYEKYFIRLRQEENKKWVESVLSEIPYDEDGNVIFKKN